MLCVVDIIVFKFLSYRMFLQNPFKNFFRGYAFNPLLFREARRALAGMFPRRVFPARLVLNSSTSVSPQTKHSSNQLKRFFEQFLSVNILRLQA